jgi:sedoheptulokinase
MSVLGIDVGSTSIKAVHYDGRAAICRSSPIELERVDEQVARLLEGLPAARAISFTGQMHGGLVTDLENRPLTPIVPWHDLRGEEAARGIRTALPASTWRRIGTAMHGGFLGATVRHFLDEGALPSRGWRIMGVYEWVACRVLEVEPYTDAGSAAAWGLYDIRAGRWADDVLEACGIPLEALPRVVAAGQRVGRGRGMDVVAGTGDTQAAYVGSGCQTDEVLANFGTGSQLMWEGDEGDDLRLLPGGRFLVTVASLAGGAAYAALRDFFASVIALAGGRVGSDLFERMNAGAAGAPSGSMGVTTSPCFNGSRGGGAERASVGGLDLGNFTAGNLCRSMLEGMVDELVEPYRRASTGHRAVVGAGNALRRNAALRTVVEERLGLPLRMSPFEEEAAMGAAFLAFTENL